MSIGAGRRRAEVTTRVQEAATELEDVKAEARSDNPP